jgi:hypothetical protein
MKKLEDERTQQPMVRINGMMKTTPFGVFFLSLSPFISKSFYFSLCPFRSPAGPHSARLFLLILLVAIL